MSAVLWLVMVMVVMVTRAAATEQQLLTCHEHCACQEDTHEYEIHYNVECNASTLLKATVTEQLLQGMSNFTRGSTHITNVTVEGGAALSLTITLDFLLQWRQVAACLLYVAGAGNVIFPGDVPPFKHEQPLQHYYAGVSLTGVSTSEVPANMFSGKEAAVLTIKNSNVGRLPAGLLHGMDSLGRLHILNSTVGMIEGLPGGPAISTKTHVNESTPVLLANSTVGVLGSGAIHLKAEQSQKIVLQGLHLTRVDSKALDVEEGQVEVEQCVAGRVEAEALLLGNTAHLTLRNNWFVLQPEALTLLQCGKDGHQIQDNHFSVLDKDTGYPVTLTRTPRKQGGEDETSEAAELENLATILSVVHHSCVPDNFGPMPSLPPPPPPVLPVLETSTSGALLAVCVVIGFVSGLIVGCFCLIFIQRYKNSQRNRHVKPPTTMVMSQLRDELIYSEPSLTPPVVPPFPNNLHHTNQNSSTCSTPDDCCGSDRGAIANGIKPVENDYV